MSELIRDLLSNRYLITPSAYFILSEYYKKNFTLAELVKFARAKNTFVIDEKLAKEFLEFKGLSSPLENFTKYIPKAPVENKAEPITATAEVPMEISTNEGSEEISIQRTIGNETTLEVLENAEIQSQTAVPAKITHEIQEMSSEEETFVSTGKPIENVASETISEEIVEEEPTIEREESFISTGTSVSEEYNGNGDEENGGRVRAVYGDYGVLVPLEEEEIPVEEKRAYSIYEDFRVEPNESFEFIAKRIKSEYEIKFDVRKVKLKPPKAKNANGKEGEIIVKVYENYFKSRLKKLRRILRENPEVSGVVDIGKLSYVNPDGEVTIIGLVNSKRETKKGFIFEVEDMTGIVKVFLGRDNEDYKKAFEILPDSVVAFRGYYSKRGILFANKLHLPDVPLYKREKPPLEEKVYAVLISDIHVGSTKFCEKAFMKFLEWLNGNVESKEEEEIVSRIKYMIIAGDVVDGIGIYPGQYNELSIPDIFDQYEALANLLANVPDHITMFIGPGNHDAARTALPQPEFYREYAKPLYDLKNAVIISNPAVINLHGRDFLVVHGRGIEDVVSYIPGKSHLRPVEPMIELLKLRHVAPTFGGKVPIAPDPEDLLVIEEVPDLVQMGHVHVLDYQIYRGVFLINSATWQAQTEFQKMVNIVPTPARVPIIDIETARLKTVVDFSRWCE
ncbi:DNA-directed DNA polymerase II small subunit [Thermococcus paralvinellae]|uniref:DNA polymerase II small subunit n=1 Tax=Thermococcus paralvinellae TaxID=582419 RepID=W0I513_9EURY|nr:DNA-directed DNA polymerase II small subunit [Thermococcus paralvinellae]AHF81206.1 DNA polymerase II small subunit [Thermococcus paralvinellae]